MRKKVSGSSRSFEGVHRLAEEVPLGTDVQLDVVAGRFNPVDLVRAHEKDASAGFDDEPLETLRGRLQILNELEQASLEISVRAPLELLTGSPERLREPISIERLEQVVERVHVERAQRVVVERRHEDDERHPLRPDGLDDLETVGAGHLHVEKDQVWLKPPDRVDRVSAVRALGDDFEPVFAGQQRPQPLARQRFVLRDQHANPAVRHAT